MQDQGQEVAEDEDPSVELGSYPGVVTADCQDEVFEGEVDTGGDECGSNDETADLNVEAVAVERIIVQHYATNIAHAFAETSHAYGNHVGPGPVFDAEDNIRNATDSEESAEEGIGPEIGVIAVYRI